MDTGGSEPVFGEEGLREDVVLGVLLAGPIRVVVEEGEGKERERLAVPETLRTVQDHPRQAIWGIAELSSDGPQREVARSRDLALDDGSHLLQGGIALSSEKLGEQRKG